jgi:hypothetical protein
MTVQFAVTFDVQIVCPCADIVLAGAAAFVFCAVGYVFDGHSLLLSSLIAVSYSVFPINDSAELPLIVYNFH